MLFNIHAIFLALGKLQGILIKEVFELFIFTFITYMLVSEYTRDPRKELKYMILGFGTFAVEKLGTSAVLASVLFGSLNVESYAIYVPIITVPAEVFALIILTNAFLFPMLANIRRRIMLQLTLLGASFFVVQLFFLNDFLTAANSPTLLANAMILFNLLKLIIMLYTIAMLAAKTDIQYRYRYSTIIAFLVFAVDPLLRLLNLLFYSNINTRLIVASHPFPMIAVILFTRVMFLKVADKAYLREKLEISEEKYKHEKELSGLKDKFVSVISHELRTPLTSINLYTSLLKEGKFGKTSTEQKNALDIIKKESNRLASLINDTLNLAKLESKKINLSIKEFNLSEFCMENPYLIIAKNKGLKFICKVPSKFIIRVDTERFRQILINLIGNALKYTDKGSITLSAKEHADKWQIDIEDTGRGIPKGELSRIFDKFYQVEHYMDRKEGGFGLGLSIVREIVKLHNGEIKVESEVGKGTRFSVFIPKNL